MEPDSCPTVKIAAPDSPGGHIVINEADFDPALHQLFGDDAPKRRGRKPKGSEDGEANDQAAQ